MYNEANAFKTAGSHRAIVEVFDFIGIALTANSLKILYIPQ
jgi:hypothetical protein